MHFNYSDVVEAEWKIKFPVCLFHFSISDVAVGVKVSFFSCSGDTGVTGSCVVAPLFFLL